MPLNARSCQPALTTILGQPSWSSSYRMANTMLMACSHFASMSLHRLMSSSEEEVRDWVGDELQNYAKVAQTTMRARDFCPFD